MNIEHVYNSTGECKSHDTDKKFEYLNYYSNQRADFIVNDRDMFKLHIHKDMSRKNFT